MLPRLSTAGPPLSPLDRARRKAYWRLLPLVFVCYVIAYVDRFNISIAKLTMAKAMPAFDDAVIGFGTGIFFLGYFLLEIPGSVMIEKWGARRWICRIMVTWGIMAALTAVVKTPHQFYAVRFLLGLAEAGFFPGVIIYLTHWFPSRDRARALAYFIIAQPVAAFINPKISGWLSVIGTTETLSDGTKVVHPLLLGLQGWQWIYVVWGVPAVVLGIVVWFTMLDRPEDAHWLTAEEKAALVQQLAQEKALRATRQKMTLWQALRHPKVLLLAAAYFCAVSVSLSMELFLPSILQEWYGLKMNAITTLVIMPPVISLLGALFVGWNSDRMKERRWHTIIPVALSLAALALVPLTHGHLRLSMLCFIIVAAGLKTYQPAFWALPSLFLTDVAAAGSIGLINSIGNLGAFYGQSMLGQVKTMTGSFDVGFIFLCGSMTVFIVIVYSLGLGRKEKPDVPR